MVKRAYLRIEPQVHRIELNRPWIKESILLLFDAISSLFTFLNLLLTVYFWQNKYLEADTQIEARQGNEKQKAAIQEDDH